MLSKQYGRIFVISAPSGTGKTTIGRKLGELIPEIQLIVSYTTKKPRSEEKEGINYHFITETRFKEMIENGEFAEWAKVYGNYYGTPKNEILKGLGKNRKVLLTIDTQGGRSIAEKFPEAVLIGILPPSLKEQERRIRNRSALSEEEICRRMSAAKEERKTLLNEYNFRLINKNLESTIKKIAGIITKGSKY